MNDQEQIAAFINAGWKVHYTGGNCTAMMKGMAKGGHLLITGEDGASPSVDADRGEFFIIGAYDDHGESLMNDDVEHGGTTPDTAMAMADKVAARFGGF